MKGAFYMLNLGQTATKSTPVSALLFMLKAVAASYIISLVLLFAASVIATYGAFSDTAIQISANIVTSIATLLAGFISGRHFSSKGIFFGAATGMIYTLLLFVIGNIFSGNINWGTSFLTALSIGILCGAVGGIAGINTRRVRRR